MTLPSSPNAISMGAINTELGLSGTAANMNMNTQASQHSPALSQPHSMSEWHGYTHATIPTAPTKCNTANHAFGIQATWFDTSSNETNFDIEWSEDGGAFGSPHSVGAGVTSAFYPDECFEGSTYACRVKSRNAAGSSAWCTDTSPVTAGVNCAI